MKRIFACIILFISGMVCFAQDANSVAGKWVYSHGFSLAGDMVKRFNDGQSEFYYDFNSDGTFRSHTAKSGNTANVSGRWKIAEPGNIIQLYDSHVTGDAETEVPDTKLVIVSNTKTQLIVIEIKNSENCALAAMYYTR